MTSLSKSSTLEKNEVRALTRKGLDYLLVVSVEESQEAGLSACSTFNATETYVVARAFNVAQIPQ